MTFIENISLWSKNDPTIFFPAYIPPLQPHFTGS